MIAPPETASSPILAAVDFSDDSTAALIWAARQAALEDVPLLVLHVVHDPADRPGAYTTPGASALRPMVDVAQDMLGIYMNEQIAAHCDLQQLKQARRLLVMGLPAGRIIEVAEAENAHLLVIGSRGLTGLDSILLGSVAERVVNLSPCPVVVVKAARQDRP